MAAEICFACTEQGFARPQPVVKCGICGKEVSWREVSRHYINHGKKSGNETVCPVCGQKVKNNEYRNHMRRHFAKRQDGAYRCGICGKSFIWLKSLMVHIMKTHE